MVYRAYCQGLYGADLFPTNHNKQSSLKFLKIMGFEKDKQVVLLKGDRPFRDIGLSTLSILSRCSGGGLEVKKLRAFSR